MPASPSLSCTQLKRRVRGWWLCAGGFVLAYYPVSLSGPPSSALKRHVVHNEFKRRSTAVSFQATSSTSFPHSHPTLDACSPVPAPAQRRAPRVQPPHRPSSC